MRNSKGQFIKGHTFNVGRKCSVITIDKIRKGNIGKIGWNKNKKWSKIVKEKIRQGHLRRGLSFIKICEVCKKEFRVSMCRKDARFCSCKCRSKVIMPPIPSRKKLYSLE